MRLGLVLLFASCDRVYGLHQEKPPDAAVDAPPCVPGDPGDEDCDGIPNELDPCPADPRAIDDHDTDMDGIGDGCDVSNATAEKRVLFDGFVDDREKWVQKTGAWTFANSTLTTADTSAEIRLTPDTAVARPYGELHLDNLVALSDTNFVALYGESSGAQSTCKIIIHATDPIHTLRIESIQMHEMPIPGSGPLRLEFYALTDGTLHCRARHNDDPDTEVIDTTKLGAVTIDTIGIQTKMATANFQSLFIAEGNP